MLRKFLVPLQSAILLRPRRVIAASALLVVAAIVLGTRLEFRNSRSELAPPDDPDQQRWTALLEEYGGSEALIACVEAAPGASRSAEELGAFADRLAAEFRNDFRVDHVFHKLDLAWLRLRGLHLLPVGTLRAAGQALQDHAESLEDLRSVTDLARLNRRVADRIEQGFRQSAELPEQAPAILAGLARFLSAERAFVEDPVGVSESWLRASPLLALAGGGAADGFDGYLKTRDGRTLFLFISIRDQDDSLDARRRLIAAMRERADSVRRRMPGFRVAFTGQPALVVDEMNTVRSDTWLTSIVAALGVALLTLAVFRWRSHALLVLAALGAGVVWAFGAVVLELGYLNLITCSFISTLVGVGVAYGIHPVSEFELEGAHTGDPVATVRESFRRTGPGVAVAALTTAAAFFSIRLMKFKGFSELGLVAGTGVLLCLLSAGVTLPALLVVYGKWRRRRDRELHRRPAPAVDRLWGPHLAGRVCRFPRATTAAALVLTALGVWGAAGLEFDADILDLLPRNAESLRYQRRMVLQSDFSPLFNIVVADDLETLAAMEERSSVEPAIERFESVLDLLPRGSAPAGSEWARWRESIDRIRLAADPTPLDRDGLVGSLRRLAAVLDEALESAFAAGLVELVGPLERARTEAESCRNAAATAAEETVAAWNEGQRRALSRAREALDEIRRSLDAEPPSLDNLPDGIRDRFFTRAGQPLGFLLPAKSVFEPRALETYVEASRRVSAEVTGFPVVFHKMSRRITTGFYRAVVLGGALVALILLIDYRSLRDALLAMTPLAIGVVWMMGGMRLLGIRFNFANLVAVPLIIGVGIDNGVHIIHRVRLEGREGMSVVLGHTGRAILIASLTTMIGFGSLSLASHRGLASLGLVLLLGVGSCLVTSTLVLPNLLVVLGFVER